MLRRTIPSIFIIMALVFLFSCSGSADKPDVPVESITLDSTEITLKAGETATLNATVSPEDATDKSLLWTSDSESITVEDGVVTVSSTATAGEYTITVTSVSNTTVKTTCTVTVEAAAAGGGGGGGSAPSYSNHTEIDASAISSGDADAKTYDVDEDTLVTLTGLTPGEVYTIYPQAASSPAAKAMSALPSAKASSSSNLIATKAGTYLLYADSETVQFGGDELGAGAGSFKLAELEPEEINLGEDMIIEEQDGLFTIEDGQKIYEKTYRVDLTDHSGFKLDDLYLYDTKAGSGSGGSDYGIIMDDGSIDRSRGKIDLSDKDYILVWQQLVVKTSNGEYEYEVSLENAIDLEYGASKNITKSPAVYRINPNGYENEELALEITLADDVDPSCYVMTTSTPEGRYADTGYWKEHSLILLQYVDDTDARKLVFYVGKLDRPIVFDFRFKSDVNVNMGTIAVRKVTEEEKARIIEIDVSAETWPYEINLDKYDERHLLNVRDYIPIVFTGDQADRTNVTVSIDKGLTNPPVDMIHFIAGPTSRVGYSQGSVPNHDPTSYSIKENRYLDHANIFIYGWTDTSSEVINLTVSKN